jgi:Winged helix DNA-binding domain
MDDIRLRAWWWKRQGLDGSLQGKSPAEVLNSAGWARSVGGSGPYFTLFSRAGISREQADAAVANLDIHELPSARGCTYVLPKEDFALGLKVSQEFSGGDMNAARKLGVTDKEIEKLCDAVLAALKTGPLDPEQIREGVGAAARSLGEEGKKKGVSTTLPLALGELQSRGEIRRLPVNGRLDQQRYRYTLWKPNPLTRFSLDIEEARTELARRFFRWIGPATVAEWQWFSGLSAKVAKAALEPLKLATVEERLLFAEDAEAFAKVTLPKKPQYALVSGLDGMFLLRRELSQLIAEEDRDKVKRLGSVRDLESNAILDRGRVVGLWEFDPENGVIAWTSFLKADAGMKDAVSHTENYIREQLGDARSFSLDSPKSRAPRIAALRKAATS